MKTAHDEAREDVLHYHTLWQAAEARERRLRYLASELLDKYEALAQQVITASPAIFATEARERLAAQVAEYRGALTPTTPR